MPARALSSAGERSLHTGEVVGSIPTAPTILAQCIDAAPLFAQVKKATKIVRTAAQFGFDLAVFSFPDWQRLCQQASPLRCQHQAARSAVRGVDLDLEKATPPKRFEICSNGRSVHCEQRRDAADRRGIRLVQRHQERKLSVCESHGLQRIVETTGNEPCGALQVQTQACVAHPQRRLR